MGTGSRHRVQPLLVARSYNTDSSGDQDAYYAKAYWRTDLWDIGAGHSTFEPEFDSDLAFIRRKDARKNIFDVAFKPRPRISWIRQINLRYFGEYYTDNDDVISEKTNHYPIIVFLENGDQLRFGPHNRFNRLFRPLTLFPGVVVPPGDYNGGSMSFTYTFDPSRPLSGAVEGLYFWGYFGGKRSVLEARAQWKPTPALILDFSSEHHRVRLPYGDFNAHLVNFGLNYSLSTTLTTSTVLRYSNQTRVKGLNFRLNYIYRPGDDLFVVYRDTRNDLNPDLSDRAILVKFTHFFTF